MQEKKLPKNISFDKKQNVYFFIMKQKGIRIQSKKRSDLFSAQFYADLIIKEQSLDRELFLTDSDFSEYYLENKKEVDIYMYIKKLEITKIKKFSYICRTCNFCNSTKLVNKNGYKDLVLKKHYPDMEYYKCLDCTIINPKSFVRTVVKQKQFNVTGYIGISKFNGGFTFKVMNARCVKRVQSSFFTLEEILWLRDDYIRHMGFDNVLNLSDEVYFAQEFKYKFNKRIDWRKSNN